MSFSTITFIIYFLPLFFTVYYLLPGKYRNTFILISSYLFYLWGSPKGALLLFATTLLDYIFVKFIYNAKKNSSKKYYFLLALNANIFVLLYYKYSNFFVDEINALLNLHGLEKIAWTEVFLPLGISFFIFHKISYLMDIYRAKAEPLTSFIDFAMYIALFPKLIMGPIVKYQDISSEVKNRHTDIDDIFDGLFRFTTGLVKKVLIADYLAVVADSIFNLEISSITQGYAWLGALCYTFQIYFDFSGYSDMAIGLGRMLGFHFPENFNRPYISNNFTEFWRRWHISLGNWFREYLYIPLGGNRVSRLRNYFNLWAVFLVCGLWHGASWTFIIWGVYHGLFLIIDKIFLLKKSMRISKIISVPATFFFIMAGWVIFRSSDIDYAFHFLQRMFDFCNNQIDAGAVLNKLPDNRQIFVIFVAAIISLFPDSIYNKLKEKFTNNINASREFWIKLLGIGIMLSLSLASLISQGFKPFIYFKF